MRCCLEKTTSGLQTELSCEFRRIDVVHQFRCSTHTHTHTHHTRESEATTTAIHIFQHLGSIKHKSM